MAHAEPPNRSRIAWPHREPPEPPTLPVVIADKRKTHRRQWAAIVALYLIVALLTYLVVINYQYVLGRGQYRDAERAADQQRAEQMAEDAAARAACIILDRLPPGPLWDPARAEYGCGPGMPPEELSPEALDQLRQLSEPPPLTTDSDPFNPNDYYAEPNPRFSAGSTGQPRETPAETTDAPTPTPPVAPPAVAPDDPATAPPLIDLNPITDPVCEALGICA